MTEPESLVLPSKGPNPGPNAPPQKTQLSFLSSFLYKAIFFVLLIALIPLFPSQAPEFANQSILTRSWELIRLLLVGIAVCYGLFSRRNADPEVDEVGPSKTDTPQAYVARILDVSSVFDDEEVESPSGYPDDSKIQTWSTQYHRGEPEVVVANGGSNGDGGSSSPLCLPVRSLKSHAQGPESIDSCDEMDEFSDSGTGSRLVFNTVEESGRKGSFRGLHAMDLKDVVKESVVLPSPIPWRSRSGRMEMKNEAPSPSAMDTNSGPFKTPSFRSSVPRSPSTTPSPRRLSPSPSLSSEMRAKTSEDSVKKKTFYRSSPPPAPPPPPPPPPVGHGSGYISDRKDSRKSFKDELKDLSRRGRDGSLQSNGSDIDSSRLETKPRNPVAGPSVGRSVRTVRWKEVEGAMLDRATKSSLEEPLEELGRAIRQPRPPPTPPARPRLSEKNELMEKMIVSSDNSDSDTDYDGKSSDIDDAPCSAMKAEPDENEVDKKADEFIAKFREQIRLQRIDSIKRSSGHRIVRTT